MTAGCGLNQGWAEAGSQMRTGGRAGGVALQGLTRGGVVEQ